MVTRELVHGLALKLVLNALSVWGISNEGKDRANTLDKQRTLCRLRIVKGSLHTIIAVRVAQQLLKACAVQEFIDHHLSCIVFRNSDALRIRSVSVFGENKNNLHLLDDVRAEFLNRKSADIPHELADDCITETIVVQVKDVLYDLGIIGSATEYLRDVQLT